MGSTNDSWPSDKKKPYLQLEGYVDEAEFSTLMQRFSMTAAPVRKGTVRIVAELFEHEVDSSLSEPWYPKDYGLLIRGEDKTYGVTRARIETVEVAFKPNAILEVDPVDTDEPDSAKPVTMDNLPPDMVSKISKDMLVSIEKRLKMISTVLLFSMGIIVAALLLR